MFYAINEGGDLHLYRKYNNNNKKSVRILQLTLQLIVGNWIRNRKVEKYH